MAQRQVYDILLWILTDQLANHDVRKSGQPTSKQKSLMLSTLCDFMAFSHNQMLSQLLLQLLLLSYCIPPPDALKEGSETAMLFLSSLTHAAAEASLESAGELIFVEVQLSFVLASAPLQNMKHASES
jgi:hypothetical protein